MRPALKLLCVVLLAFATANALHAAEKKKIVFFAGPPSDGYGAHEYHAGCLLLAKSLQQGMPNYEVDVIRSNWPEPLGLESADVLIMYCDRSDARPASRFWQSYRADPTYARWKEVEAQAERGMGVICIHHAVEEEQGGVNTVEEASDWIGGFGWRNEHWDASFNALPEHPITRGVTPFKADDGWASRSREEMTNVTPILSAARFSDSEPSCVAWAAERSDGGRGFAFSGGHWHWNWANRNYRKVVLNAIVWCAKDEVPANGVESGEIFLDRLFENQDDPKPADLDLEYLRNVFRLATPGAVANAASSTNVKSLPAEAAPQGPTNEDQQALNELVDQHFRPSIPRSTEEELQIAKELCIAWRQEGLLIIEKLLATVGKNHPNGRRILEAYKAEKRVLDVTKPTQDYIWLKQTLTLTQSIPVERVRVAYSDRIRELQQAGDAAGAAALESEAKAFLKSVGSEADAFTLSWRTLPAFDLALGVAMTVGPLQGAGRCPDLGKIDRWLHYRICDGLGLPEDSPSRASWRRLAAARVLEARAHGEFNRMNAEAAAATEQAKAEAAARAAARAAAQAAAQARANAQRANAFGNMVLGFVQGLDAANQGDDGTIYVDEGLQAEADARFNAGLWGLLDPPRLRSTGSGGSGGSAGLAKLKALEHEYRALERSYGSLLQFVEVIDRDCAVKLAAAEVVPRDDERIRFRLEHDRVTAVNRTSEPIEDLSIYCGVTGASESEKVVRCGVWYGVLEPGKEVTLIRNARLAKHAILVDALCDAFRSSAKLTISADSTHPDDDLGAADPEAAEVRTWTSDVGTEIRAKLLRTETSDDGTSSVRLQREDGTEVVVPLARLSKADREFVEGR